MLYAGKHSDVPILTPPYTIANLLSKADRF